MKRAAGYALAELAQRGEEVPDIVKRAYPGENFGFDILGEKAGHGIVFLTPLMPLSIPASVGYLDYDHRRNALLGNQVVQHVRDHLVGLSLRAVVADHEGG